MSIKLEVGQIVELNDGDLYKVKASQRDDYPFEIDGVPYTVGGKYLAENEHAYNVKRIIYDPNTTTPHKPETLSRRDQFAMAFINVVAQRVGIERNTFSTSVAQHADALIAELDKEVIE